MVIINIYSISKFFLDCLRTNNSCLEYYEEIVSIRDDISEDLAIADRVYDIKLKNATKRLKLSKQDNLLPTYFKILSLFDNLNDILKEN